MTNNENASKIFDVEKQEEKQHYDDTTVNEESDDESSVGTNKVKMGFGFMTRYPILSLVGFVLTGVFVGIGLSYWQPTDADGQNDKDVALQWIGLVGDMFLRMLKCLVLPIVFVNVVIAVVDMMQLSKVGGVAGRTVLLYLATTICAGVIACIYSGIFMNLYHIGEVAEVEPAYVSLGCNEENSYLTEFPNGTVGCSSDIVNESSILFQFNDVNNTFATNGGSSVTELSLSDTIYSGIFETLIPSNIFVEFYNSNFAAVIVFAIAMGVAAAKVISRQQINSSDLTVLSWLVEMEQILMVMIIWVITLTPFAVLSLIAQTIGGVDDLAKLFINMGFLVACIITCYITHIFVTFCGGYYVLTKGRNPFSYLKHLVPAQIMALSIASSAATIPLSLESVKSTNLVPDAISRFVIPLGATVNMDGACIQIVTSCIWLAMYNGVEVGVANFIMLLIISTFGSMGTAPISNSGLALILTSYNTIFGTTGTPEGFSLLFAIDWFIDRMSTAVNVTGDMMVCGVIGSQVDVDITHSVRSEIKEYQHSHREMFSSMASTSGRMMSMPGSSHCNIQKSEEKFDSNEL